MDLRLSVGGDPDGGWLVDIHDGDRNEVYRPEASKTAAEAAVAALIQHDPGLELPDSEKIDGLEAELVDAKKALVAAEAKLKSVPASVSATAAPSSPAVVRPTIPVTGI